MEFVRIQEIEYSHLFILLLISNYCIRRRNVNEDSCISTDKAKFREVTT